jgi:hypothetical protein
MAVVSTCTPRWWKQRGHHRYIGLTGGEVIPLDGRRRSGLQRPSRLGFGAMSRLVEFPLQDGGAILVQVDEAAADLATHVLIGGCGPLAEALDEVGWSSGWSSAPRRVRSSPSPAAPPTSR